MSRYINADALEEAIQKFPYGYRGVIKSVIAQIPTADVVERKDIEAELDLAYKHGWSDCFSDMPERKKGEWIRHSIGHENTPWGFDCSTCGKWFVISEDTAEQYHFCPNCGADMRKETEDE